MAAEKLAARDLADAERRAEEWGRHAEQAVRAGDDALARQALTRKQEQDRTAAALRDQAAATADASGAMRRQLEAMQAKLSEANRRLGTIVARNKAAAVRAKIRAAEGEVMANTEAFDAFERLRKKVERAEAESEALRELSQDAGRRGEAAAPAAAAGAVEAELADLKKNLRQ